MTEEAPPRTDGAAEPSSGATMGSDSTPRAASVLRTDRKVPRGKPFRPQPDSRLHSTTIDRGALATSGAIKRPQPHEVAAYSRWHRGQPPAAPAQAALSSGTLPTALRRWPGRRQPREATADQSGRPHPLPRTTTQWSPDTGSVTMYHLSASKVVQNLT